MILADLIKYFSKFVSKTVLMKNFKIETDKFDGYTELKAFFDTLPAIGIVPELTDFIFTLNETKLAERVKTISGYFLLIEYSVVTISAPDNLQNRSSRFNLAVIIGHHYDSKGLDSIAELLIMDKCYAICQTILRQMKVDDSNSCGINRLLDGSIKLAPFEPQLLYESIGWEFSFQKTVNII